MLEIFENFEQILKKFFEIPLYSYSFQINFPKHYVSSKNGGGHMPPPKVKPLKLGGRAPMPPDRLWFHWSKVKILQWPSKNGGTCLWCCDYQTPMDMDHGEMFTQ